MTTYAVVVEDTDNDLPVVQAKGELDHLRPVLKAERRRGRDAKLFARTDAGYDEWYWHECDDEGNRL